MSKNRFLFQMQLNRKKNKNFILCVLNRKSIYIRWGSAIMKAEVDTMLKMREKYLNTLISYQNSEFVKVITGVRRAGKSFLLRLFCKHLSESGIPERNIIYINFEHFDSESLKTAQALNEYLKTKVSGSEKTYFLFDEIQEVEEWQKVINGLRVAYDSDIYITGSNASLLSGELATYLSGRYVEIKVLPLSFQEFLEFRNYQNEMKYPTYLKEFMEDGAFPAVSFLNDRSMIENVLQSLFDSILLKDVCLRGGIKDTSLLLRVVKYLLDNIGNQVSSSSIANALSSFGRKTSHETIDRYLSLLEDAFVFYKAERYDIRGKERLKTLGKYYVVDLGLRNSVLGKNRGNFGSQMENIVFLELKRRGFEVSVGKWYETEIDFVCTKPQKTLYVQVTYQLPQDSLRETENLLSIPNNYDKVLVVGNKEDSGVIEGIKVIYLVDFLLDESLI